MTAPRPRLTDEQRLGFIVTQVGRWRAWILHVQRPLAGSTLAEDDTIFPPFTLSQLAWQGLCSGVDHLDLFASALVATRTGYPSAYFTLSRAGVVGAAHALWLLDGDRAQRQRRALRMAHEDYRQERAAMADIKRLMPGAAELATSRIEQLTQRMGEVVTAGAGLGMTAQSFKKKINDGQIIEDMARRFATGPEANDLIAAYVVMWRQHSGAACAGHCSSGPPRCSMRRPVLTP
jgi:hypothetical protein